MSFLNLGVVAGVLALLALLRVIGARSFTWTLAIWVCVYAFLRMGFAVPIPASVILIYMGITTIALAAYITSSAGRREQFLAPLDALVNDPSRRTMLGLVLLGLPVLAGFAAHRASQTTLEAPGFSRTVHPAPPDSITVHDKAIDLAKVRNPFRTLETSDPKAYREHIDAGKRTYYRNCFYCHGDALLGDGMFAHGLNPIPTNFQDKGTIAMLQEGFLFWRIAKGGPGLPAEGGPWDSAMPAWEKFLKEDEIWEVVLFLYDHTNQRPRAEGEHH